MFTGCYGLFVILCANSSKPVGIESRLDGAAIKGDFPKIIEHIQQAVELARKNKLTSQQYNLQLRLLVLYASGKNYEASLNNAKEV